LVAARDRTSIITPRKASGFNASTGSNPLKSAVSALNMQTMIGKFETDTRGGRIERPAGPLPANLYISNR